VPHKALITSLGDRGTFWGELGFFKIEKGINALFLEDGDCWYAEPSFDMETEVRKGDLVGTMYGVVENDQAKLRPRADARSTVQAAAS
jgi:cathepsin X